MTEKAPQIDPRFIYNVKRFDRDAKKYTLTPQLNADGHIDYAYQCGLENVITEIIDSHITDDQDGGHTHWVTVKATVHVKDRTVTGLACANSRKVTEPGFEVAVAETRAIKRAIAVACNITEKVINPGGKVPTREFVDQPVEEPEETEVPKEITKHASEIINADEQFVV